MKQLLPMCTVEELNTQYEDAGDRVWHLVPDQTKKPWPPRSLCGIRPGGGGWAGVGLVPTCPICIEKQNAGETRDARPYRKLTGPVLVTAFFFGPLTAVTVALTLIATYNSMNGRF